MRHQSLRPISRKARERMMRDVACDPEFPPELMMSGMNSVSTIAFSSSAW